MANMIMTTTRITVSSANRSELFQTILTLLTPVMNEKGCLSSRFYLDSADNNSAMLVEEWETRGGLGQSPAIQGLRSFPGRRKRTLQAHQR